MARSAVAAAWSALRGRMPWIASTTGIPTSRAMKGKAAIPGCGAVLRVSTGTEMEHGPEDQGQDADCEDEVQRGDGNQEGAGAQNERQQRSKGRQRRARLFQPTRVKSMTIAPGSRCRYSMVMPSP